MGEYVSADKMNVTCLINHFWWYFFNRKYFKKNNNNNFDWNPTENTQKWQPAIRHKKGTHCTTSRHTKIHLPTDASLEINFRRNQRQTTEKKNGIRNSNHHIYSLGQDISVWCICRLWDANGYGWIPTCSDTDEQVYECTGKKIMFYDLFL